MFFLTILSEIRVKNIETMNFNEAETKELADFYNQEKIRIQAQLRHVEKILRKISGRTMDSSGVILTKQGFKAKKRGSVFFCFFRWFIRRFVLRILEQMNFNEAETAELADFYNQEKIRIQAQLRHVEKILRKISGRNMDSSGVILTKQGFQAKKRGPKSVWGKFILEQLAICNRPMSYKELMEIAMKHHGGGNSNYQSIRASILNSAFRLRSIQGKVATVHQEGKKEKFIVLIQWLDDKGMLPKEQQNWLKKEKNFFPSAVDLSEIPVPKYAEDLEQS